MQLAFCFLDNANYYAFDIIYVFYKYGLGEIGGKDMVLMIDTTVSHLGKDIMLEVEKSSVEKYELISAQNMNISHCIGCNYCWLKTPGICTIKDDYEQILQKMILADQVWLIADTKFGFVSYKAKNIIDRVMPLVTMYLKFKDGEMRHVMRYDNPSDLGVIYKGEAEQKFLETWISRVAINFGSKSLGAYNERQLKEAISCML